MSTLSSLILSASEDTPEVLFSAEEGMLRIDGRSLPENAYNFYHPLIEWTRVYCKLFNQPTSIELNLDYFNSSSGRYLFEILTIVELESKDRTKFSILWKVEKDDELMIEKGEELKSLLDLPFVIELI